MSGIIFFVCSTSWISRCSLAAISVMFFLIRSGSGVPCQVEDKKGLPVKVHQRQNQSHWIRRWRSRYPWIWCCTTRWVRGRTVRKIWAIPSIRECRKRTRRWSWHQETDAEPKPRSNRRFLIEATGSTQNSDSWKQEDRVAPSSSTSTRKLVREVNTKEFHNVRISNHQYSTKDFQHLQKKLGITTGHSTFAIEARRTNVVRWRLFMFSSIKAAIHLGPNYPENLEVFKNTNFEENQNLLNITQKLVLEDYE